MDSGHLIKGSANAFRDFIENLKMYFFCFQGTRAVFQVSPSTAGHFLRAGRTESLAHPEQSRHWRSTWRNEEAYHSKQREDVSPPIFFSPIPQVI